MKYYYFVDNNRSRQGPFPIEELLSHGVTPDTLIWCKGMDKWEKAKEVPEIAILFIKVKRKTAEILRIPAPYSLYPISSYYRVIPEINKMKI